TLAVDITETATFTLTCGADTASVTLHVHSVGAIVGPGVVVVGDTGTFTLAVADVASCDASASAGNAPSAVSITDGVATFTDVVDVDATLSVTCGDIVRTVDVAALFVTPADTALVANAGSDLALDFVTHDGASCTLASVRRDGTQARDEAAVDVGSSFAVADLVEARTYTITCSLGGASTSADVVVDIRPVIVTFDPALGAVSGVALTWTINGQSEGLCSLSDGTTTTNLVGTTKTFTAGSGTVDYRISCAANLTDNAPNEAHAFGGWAAVNLAGAVALGALGESVLVVTVTSAGETFSGTVSLGGLREIDGFVSVGGPVGSNLTFTAPALTRVVGNVSISGLAWTEVDIPLLQVGGNLTISGTSADFVHVVGDVAGSVTVSNNSLTEFITIDGDAGTTLSIAGNSVLNLRLATTATTFSLTNNTHLVDLTGALHSASNFTVTGNSDLQCAKIVALYCVDHRDFTPTVSNNAAASCTMTCN
ncbi:MAG TPA: hypothetical protein VGO62_08070, partial [Myxococcota bacterium]